MHLYDIAMRYVLWFLFFVGLLLLLFPLFQPNYKKVRRYMTNKKVSKKSKGTIYKKTEQLLVASLNIKGSFAVYSFLLSLLIISIMTFASLTNIEKPLPQAIMFSIIAPLFPIAFLKYRLRQLRIKTSHEGQFMVSEILNNYRIFHFNPIEALDHSVMNLNKHPNSKKVLSRLALGLKEYQSEEELEQIINDFRYSIDTSWANLLGNLLYNASLYGDNIQEGLTDILEQLKMLESLKEKGKQINLEGSIMLKIFIPGMLLGSFYVMYEYFGFTVAKYIEYQFLDSIGYTVFFYTLITILFTTLIYLAFSKEKNDF